jgi:transposase
MIDETLSYTLDCCPDCGGDLLFWRQAEPRVIQQAELLAKPLWVTKHRAGGYWCPKCRRVHYAPLHAAVEQTGLFGPKLTTLVAFMKGVCHASFSRIRKFLRDVTGIKVSRGYLARLIAKVSRGLGTAYEELLARLPGEAFLKIDETGHRENAKKFWTWCFRAELYTLFRIQPTCSEAGRRWCERIWTTIATCVQQGRSAFEFLLETVQAHIRAAPPPSLLPSGS